MNFEGDKPVGDQDLESFRAQWKQELVERRQGSPGQSQEGTQEEQAENEKLHEKARGLFLQGVKMEETGKLYDAIKYYKKAVNLVPDIEKEVFSYTKKEVCITSRNSSEVKEMEKVEEGERKEGKQEEIGNLVDRFSQVKLDNQPFIQQEFQTKSKHIGEMPVEVLNYIFKWVVSSELDLRSLEACSQVCKGFYLLARDTEIWRLVCIKVFGAGVVSSQLPWRQLYISRPRVNFNGCYVAKTTYIREGERGFQDHESYRAWHIVEYYRFFRFFPGGRVLMVISAEDPGLTAKLMNNRKFCSIQGSMFGEYRISENTVYCILHKPKPKKVQPKFGRKKRRDQMIYNDTPDQDFLIELSLKGKGSRVLHWKSYQICSRYLSGRETIDSVSLSESNFPRLKFSRVGTYHFESCSPL